MAGHRTAQGKMVDMSQLAARNEKVRAVGNMNVNARGDIIDSHNRIIQDNTKRVKSSYQKIVAEKQHKNPPPVPQGKPRNIPAVSDPNLSNQEKEFFEDDEDIEK